MDLSHLVRPARQLTVALLTCLISSVSSAEDSLGQRMIDDFKASDFEFARGRSNVPFLPLAFLSAQAYSETEVEGPEGEKLTYDMVGVSQGAGIPLLLGQRDMLVIGEYLSWNEFDFEADERDEFDVYSVGVPVGWMRQVDRDWQAAAFVMPMGHYSSADKSDWSWQYMGGAFARWSHREDLWWAFGLYADISEEEEFYIPYVGASWTINERWTLSAIMPWPALLYAPNRNWLFRVGASPSGASWSINPDADQVAVNLNTWDLGVSAERRLWTNLWLAVEAGYGGLSSLSLDNGGGIEDPDFDLGGNGYISTTLRFRPAVQDL